MHSKSAQISNFKKRSTGIPEIRQQAVLILDFHVDCGAQNQGTCDVPKCQKRPIVGQRDQSYRVVRRIKASLAAVSRFLIETDLHIAKET